MTISPQPVTGIDNTDFQLHLRDQLVEAEGLVTIKDVSKFLTDLGNPRMCVETIDQRSLKVSLKSRLAENNLPLLIISI